MRRAVAATRCHSRLCQPLPGMGYGATMFFLAQAGYSPAKDFDSSSEIQTGAVKTKRIPNGAPRRKPCGDHADSEGEEHGLSP